MLLLIKYTLLYGIVLMLVALGGMFSEHSGIINIALEGIMVIGGVAGVLTLTMLPASLSPFLVVLISILVAALAGVIYSLLLAFASINLKADQTIGGTALNLLATAIAVVISKYFSESGSAKLNYSNKPFLFSIGGLELSVFVPLGLILLVVSYIVLYKTRFGLRLRACGEHPQAADSVGINVYKMRYAGVILSGALGAIGGLAYIVPPVQTWNFEVGVAGAGFLALAVMIFGQWKPFHIFGAAMFFAVFKSLANIADSTFLAQLHWSSNIYNMMPFVASMVILAFTSKNSMAPKAEGIPYDNAAPVKRYPKNKKGIRSHQREMDALCTGNGKFVHSFAGRNGILLVKYADMLSLKTNGIYRNPVYISCTAENKKGEFLLWTKKQLWDSRSEAWRTRRPLI